MPDMFLDPKDDQSDQPVNQDYLGAVALVHRILEDDQDSNVYGLGKNILYALTFEHHFVPSDGREWVDGRGKLTRPFIDTAEFVAKLIVRYFHRLVGDTEGLAKIIVGDLICLQSFARRQS